MITTTRYRKAAILRIQSKFYFCDGVHFSPVKSEMGSLNGGKLHQIYISLLSKLGRFEMCKNIN